MQKAVVFMSRKNSHLNVAFLIIINNKNVMVGLNAHRCLIKFISTGGEFIS